MLDSGNKGSNSLLEFYKQNQLFWKLILWYGTILGGILIQLCEKWNFQSSQDSCFWLLVISGCICKNVFCQYFAETKELSWTKCSVCVVARFLSWNYYLWIDTFFSCQGKFSGWFSNLSDIAGVCPNHHRYLNFHWPVR